MTQAKASTRSQIQNRLQQLQAAVTEQWIDTGDLCIVFSALQTLRAAGEDMVPGTFLAHALHRLTVCELQLGGPYSSSDGQVDPAANRAIAQFLQYYDVALPALQMYLDAPTTGVLRTNLSADDKRVQLLVTRVTTPGTMVHEHDPTIADSDTIQQRVLASAKRRMESLPEPLRTTGLAVWDEMRRADRNNEIVLIPQLFADLLVDRSGITDDQLVLLGEANFFCWIATILYDDFIDEEGEPARLPIANVSYRISLELYRQALPAQPKLYAAVERWYDAVDRANAWEVAATRATVFDGVIRLVALPRYGNRTVLADRAFGHTIAPMLLAMQRPGVQGRQIRQVQRALEHYLIARQLNDDIHDWRKDLAVGQLSVVVTDMLHAVGIQHGSYRLNELTARLERYFFRAGLARQCDRLISHIQACRQALQDSGLAKSTGGFMDLVNDLEASARAAERIQANEQAFLQTYRQLTVTA